MIYAMIATLLATLAFIALIALIRSQSLFADFVPFLSDFSALFATYAWLSVPLFVILGALSAFLASWKYIHSTIGE